jgi:hypothetical protein
MRRLATSTGRLSRGTRECSEVQLSAVCGRALLRWGCLFEALRGPAVVLKGASYTVDPNTKAINRGYLEPAPEQPLLAWRCRPMKASRPPLIP